MTEETESAPGWFNQAARSSVLNALWLGPLNIYYWFSSGRFDAPYYVNIAKAQGLDIDEVIASTLAFEMVLMVFSLFAVSAAFYASKAKSNSYTFILFMVCATLLWNGLSYLLGL